MTYKYDATSDCMTSICQFTVNSISWKPDVNPKRLFSLPDLVRDFFVSYVEGLGNLHGDCFESLQKQRPKFGFSKTSLRPHLSLADRSKVVLMLPQCYMLLCQCVYGLQKYDHLNNSCPFCFLFDLICDLKKENM